MSSVEVPELPRWERRALSMIERNGIAAFAGAVAAISVLFSVSLTVPLMVLTKSSGVDIAIAVGLAVFVPSIVAPAVATLIGRLVQALGVTSNALHRLAHTDALTGVANRRAFTEQAGELWERRHGAAAVVAMIDVDDFKKVNDHHGHATGDLVLVTLAAELTAVVHRHASQAVVGRLGGDEFAVVALLPDPITGKVLIDDLARACRLEAFRPAVTATSGAIIAPIGSSLDEALGRADHALYASKQHGSRSRRPANGDRPTTGPADLLV